MGQNATFIKLKIGTTLLIGETSSSYNSTADVIDISSKASGRVRRILPGRVSENISFESLADDTNSSDYGYATAHAALKDGTAITFEIGRYDANGDQVDGSETESGSGYVMSLTKDNPDNDRTTMSGTIEVDGETTVGTYTAP